MRKIKDTPIGAMLPKKEVGIISGVDVISRVANGLRQRRNDTIDKVLNTDIQIDDIVEVDVDTIKDVVLDMSFKFSETGFRITNGQVVELTNAIAKSGVIKWKEKK